MGPAPFLQTLDLKVMNKTGKPINIVHVLQSLCQCFVPFISFTFQEEYLLQGLIFHQSV